MTGVQTCALPISWPEGDLLEGAAILAERDLAFGAAVEIVEHGPGQSTTRDWPEILYADNPRGGDLAARSSHRPFRHELANVDSCTGTNGNLGTPWSPGQSADATQLSLAALLRDAAPAPGASSRAA